MKKLCIAAVIMITAMSCASAGQFSDVSGKSWKLIEVRIDDRDTLFNRKELSAQKAGDIFTLRFDNTTISGKGAPNNYSAPYTLGENQAIHIEMVRSTLMATIIHEPEKLREYDFFMYIQNAYKWNLVNKNFMLYSKNEEGAEITLKFSL